MKNIRFKNANVFNNNYCGDTFYYNSASAFIDSFSASNKFYSYHNKYLINDDMYLTLSRFSATQSYTIYNRNPNTYFFDKPDFVKSIIYNSKNYSFSGQISLTGNGYQYVYSQSGFAGWFFPYQKSIILRNDFILPDSLTASILFAQTVSYYMSQQSYFLKVNDHERNNSYNCITAAQHTSYTANQFIKGKPTYITSIGLYDDNMQCLAVAKLSKPIQKLQFVPMSFKVRFFN